MKGKILITLAIGLGILFAYYAEKVDLHADSPSFQVYTVTIQGAVGDIPFSRRGTLFVTSAQPEEQEVPGSEGGDSNRVNFWLVSGKPSGTAGKGAIWLATNDSFYGGNRNENFASVYATPNEIYAEFDPESGLINANAFSISALRQENAVRLVEGWVQVNMDFDGKVEGTIHLVGLDSSGQSTIHYTVAITGDYAGNQSW